jgi:perosamine synthetase
MKPENTPIRKAFSSLHSFEPWAWPPADYSPAVAVHRFLSHGGSLTPQGRVGVVRDCEDALCARFDQPRAVLCCSGTMALYAAFFAADLGPGDELVCPAITFHATASPALRLGAGVVLADVDPLTACIDPQALEAAITPRTKALVTNAQWGHPVEQDRVRSICDRHGLVWIEDISHAHGATWNGRQVGTWGDLACMSLGAEKMLTGGLAGVLFGKRDDLVDRAVLVTHYLHRSKNDVRTPGFEPLARTGFGLKLGIHPLAAVVILDQLENHFDQWVEERRASLERLSAGLAELPHLRPPVIRPEVTSMGGWYGYKPWVDFKNIGVSRESLVEKFHQRDVEVDIPGSPPLPELPLFSDPRWNPAASANAAENVPAANQYARGTLSLPTFTGQRDADRMAQMIETFHEIWTESSWL